MGSSREPNGRGVFLRHGQSQTLDRPIERPDDGSHVSPISQRRQAANDRRHDLNKIGPGIRQHVHGSVDSIENRRQLEQVRQFVATPVSGNRRRHAARRKSRQRIDRSFTERRRRRAEAFPAVPGCGLARAQREFIPLSEFRQFDLRL